MCVFFSVAFSPRSFRARSFSRSLPSSFPLPPFPPPLLRALSAGRRLRVASNAALSEGVASATCIERWAWRRTLRVTLHSLFTHACLLYALRRLLSALSSGTLTSVDAPLMERNEACNICGEQLEVDLGTAMCYADAHVQVVLHCTHTFCTQCLIKWRKLQGKRSQVTCPMCRAPLDGTDYCAMYGLHADVGSDDPYVRRISRYGERNAARAS